MLNISSNKINKWIFVTGVIRSGTTFVGKILSLPLEVDYIHEPFNHVCGMPGMTKFYRYVRPSLDTEEMLQYHELTKSIFNYKLTLRSKVSEKDLWSQKIIKTIVGSRGPFYLRLAKLNPFHKAAIIKDPTGNLLSEYLYVNFKVKPVIIIKHPTSFIASLKRVNWWPKLSEINDQNYLIEDYFADETDFIFQQYSDPILAAAAYWRATYKVLLTQASKYADWQIITHEELSQEPIKIFQQLYQKFDLPWSKSIESKIVNYTQGNHSAQARKGKVQDFQRNSADIFKMHRDSLTSKERQQIFEIVQDVALQIYNKETFAID